MNDEQEARLEINRELPNYLLIHSHFSKPTHIPDTPVSVGSAMKLYCVEIENIQTWDCPDFANAYITYAEIDDPKTGERRELTEQELEDLDPAYAQEYIWDYIF